MTYSCVDFTDNILNALGITVPEEHRDNTEHQADLACSEIWRLQKRDAVCDKLVSMLDSIHTIMDSEKEARYLIPHFDEIGCLIAEARGEYTPDDDPSKSEAAALAEIERLKGLENKAWLLVVHSDEELSDLIEWIDEHPSDEEMSEEGIVTAARVRLNAWLLRLAGAQSENSYPCFAAVPPALARLLEMLIDDWSEVEGSHDAEFNTTLIEQEG
ncbi:hypothetical protein [Bradyrhizobium erythrophlei]|uniref:Uncharacterized protein n=1 Tax=Bradyrhizobium erythrophlei TaxID=1437360 RepID=A0A1M5PSH3_9BRAD|nr:hypothetical protein [Bradyrhizobium erythrophlei]SHH04794.1 hypothetical protein SAMN05443248_3494 [Bradyrhizobium erythrophlei]